MNLSAIGERRLASLEEGYVKLMRRERLATLACVVLASLTLLIKFAPNLHAQAVPPAVKIVEAEEFWLMDRADKARGALTLGSDQEANFFAFDRAGRMCLSFGISDDNSPGIQLSDLKSDVVAMLAVNHFEQPSLLLYEANEPSRLWLGVDDNKVGFILLNAADGHRTVSLDAEADGSTWMAFLGHDKRSSFRAWAESNGNFGLYLLDKEGWPLIDVPGDPAFIVDARNQE